VSEGVAREEAGQGIKARIAITRVVGYDR